MHLLYFLEVLASLVLRCDVQQWLQSADHPLLPECHDNQQWLEDAEFCRAPWKDWVDCKRRTANGREFQSVMVWGKKWIFEDISTNWQWHKFIFVSYVLCGDAFCFACRWHLRSGNLAWWRKHTNWAFCVIVRLLWSSSTGQTDCSSMQALIWTASCWDTLSTMSRTRAALTVTSLRL